MDKLKIMTKENFTEYQGSTFNVIISDQVTLPAVLAEIVSMKHHPDQSRQPFSLIFQTEQTDQYYAQGIFRLTHEKMGELELFLVPLGPSNKNGKMLYEAVFN